MVYYQSTPLIVKTEQPSQAQFCTPLRTTTPTTTYSTSSPSPSVTLIPNATTFTNFHQQLLPMHAQQQNTITTTTVPHNYNNINNHVNETIILQHQQQQAQSPNHHHQTQQQHQNQNQQQSTSITITNSNGQQQQHQQEQSFLLTNIKQEQLPPSIRLYTQTTTPPTAATKQQPVQLTTTTTPITPATTTISTTRKNNANGQKPQFKCEQCGMIFGSKSAHTSHVKSHAKSGEATMIGGNSNLNAATTTFELNEAGLPIGIPKMPQIIPNSTGGSDPYQCNVCQKTFAVPARLIRHYRTHTGERPFECEFCHKLFSVKENLQVHRRIHTKERPYKCDVCGRAFEHSGKLHRHMRIHTGERPHKCSVCQKTFIQSGQLVIHMRTHTGEKPYKCPVEGCGKGFTCSKQLKVHSRTHTGEKPYHCDICFRDFGYNHVLKLHRVQHYGSKCYKCTICDKTFKSKKEMEAHIKGHANEMPDDEEAYGTTTTKTPTVSGQTSSISSSGGETTNSPPGSPQSPNVAVTVAATKTRKPRQPRTPRTTANNKSPPSPSSPSSTYSPSSSMASASRLSAGSPLSSIASSSPATTAVNNNATTATIETDLQYNSRDSGVATNFSGATNSNLRQLLSHQLSSNSPPPPLQIAYGHVVDELPTDLSKTTSTAPTTTTTLNYYQTANTTTNTFGYIRQMSPIPQQTTLAIEPPTINPALLEAATIASEEEVTKAALQIMQLHRSSATSNLQVQPTIYTTTAYGAQQDEDTVETNELIAHYKRGELARHGLHKRYAPVPKFESSLLNNDTLVRQVEAAIAPLRSSTESPERSSSPESDSLMLVDRDVMTLPLRKRKLYMNGEHDEHVALALSANSKNGNTNNSNGNESTVPNQKVMRMSSVIQFAKAS